MKGKKSIIKFSESFRESCRAMGWSEDDIRQIELDTIKRQARLREGLEEVKDV